jgi:hypothetical protein
VTCTLSPGLGGLSAGKRGERQNAFGFVSDIENDGVGGHGDDRAFAALGAGFLLAGVALLVLGKDVFEGFDRLGELGAEMPGSDKLELEFSGSVMKG